MARSRKARSKSQQPANSRGRIERLAKTPWIEAGIGTVIGFIFLFFQNSNLAQLSWILGVALSFSRYAYTEKLEEELEPVHDLAAIVDLQGQMSVGEFQELVRIYLHITEPEFRRVKDYIIIETTQRLRKLAEQKTSDILETSEYFNWLFPTLEATEKGSHIWAVSMMIDIEWQESQVEDRFMQLNLDAASRGIRVERIFVVPRATIPALLTNKYVKYQYENRGEYMNPLVVEREYLERYDPKLLSQLGEGFIAVDDRVVLLDMASPTGFRGFVTMNQGEITRIRHLYDNLRVNARPMEEALRSAKP